MPAVKSLSWGLALFVLFWALGLAPLTDLDEGAFSEASREMMVRGDWVSPWLLDAPRFDKPVLFHWLQIASLQILGLNSWGARMPSALAGIAWIAGVVYWSQLLLARLAQDQQAQASPSSRPSSQEGATVAMAIAIGCLAIPAMSRAATADALLNACLIWTLIFVWRALCQSPTIEQVRSNGRWAALFAGLGLLTKGPVAVVVPAGGILLFGAFQLLRRSRREHLSTLWALKGLLLNWWAWLILLVIPAPWYLSQYQAQGMAFIEGFLGLHNLGRFTNAMHGFRAGPLYHPAWTLITLFPFLPLLILTLIKDCRPKSWANNSAGFLWGVWLFVMVFFSISATKLPHYTFYGLSALMVLMAVRLATTNTNDRLWVMQRAWLAFCVVALMSAGHILGANLYKVGDPYYQTVLKDAVLALKLPPLWVWVLSAGGVLVCLVPTLYVWLGQRLSLLLGAFSFSAVLFGHHVPSTMSSLRGPIPAMVTMASEANAALVSWRMSSPSISFWANRVIADRLPTGEEWVLLHSHHLPALLLERPAAVYTPVMEQNGLLLVRPIVR